MHLRTFAWVIALSRQFYFIFLPSFSNNHWLYVHNFRKMSSEEKRSLGTALTQLSPEDLSKALEIVAETNPSFQATAQEVDLDIDAQVIIYLFVCSLWLGLSFFVPVAQIGYSSPNAEWIYIMEVEGFCERFPKRSSKESWRHKRQWQQQW